MPGLQKSFIPTSSDLMWFVTFMNRSSQWILIFAKKNTVCFNIYRGLVYHIQQSLRLAWHQSLLWALACLSYSSPTGGMILLPFGICWLSRPTLFLNMQHSTCRNSHLACQNTSSQLHSHNFMLFKCVRKDFQIWAICGMCGFLRAFVAKSHTVILHFQNSAGPWAQNVQSISCTSQPFDHMFDIYLIIFDHIWTLPAAEANGTKKQIRIKKQNHRIKKNK